MIQKRHDTTIPVSEDPERTQIGGPVEVFPFSSPGFSVALRYRDWLRKWSRKSRFFSTFYKATVMSDETKTPQAGEWWVHDCGRIRFIVGKSSKGSVIIEENGMVGVARGWDNWHHEPRCTGFDWVEPPAIDPGDGYRIVDRDEEWLPTDERAYSDCITGDDTDWGPISLLFEDRKKSPTVADIARGRTGLMVRRRKSVKTAIDPGEGWELLPVGTMLQEGDEFESGGDWNKTCYPGTKNIKGWTYRRRKPPAEVWPKYYVTILNSDGYYYCVSESEVWHICSAEIVRQSAKAQTLTNKDVWREVTESEAKARVKPADPLPALIPGIATDRMVDLFLSWRLPSDFQPDGGISFTSRPIHESWPTGTNLFTATQARGMIEHLLSVPEETSRVKPAEPIDQATKALHDLAIDAGIDPLGLDPAEIAEKLIAKQQVTGCPGESPDRVPDHRPAREVIMDIVSWLDEKDGEIASPCMALETAQQWLDENPEEPAPFAKPFNDPRSGMGIRKDHVSWRPNSGQYDAATDVTYHAETPVESPDDWVTQDRVPARPGIDERRYHYSSGDISAWADSAYMCWNRPVMNRAPIKHIKRSGGWVELRCRRKDLPPVESTDDWIEITDPEHVLREGIDEVWYSFEDILNEWQKVGPSAGMRLNDSQYKRARCRRRDLPAPQPKTMDVSPGEGWRWVEKDEPWQEGDDCLICDFTHPHTHNCQCWRRRIVPQPKRTPVRLFVSADVRWGDRYIVSVKDGNPNPERHQEIKFDGSRFYVEGIE